MTISVLLADDHAAVRMGLRMILESADGIEVAGEASDGETAVTMTRQLSPDVVLMDIRMPGVDGIAATRSIVSGNAAKVLILTTFDIDEYVFEALRAGAAGFVLKSIESAQLVEAVQRVADGDGVLTPEITAKVIGHFSSEHGSGPAPAEPPERVEPLEPLTAREEDVLEALGAGMSNQQIARQLFIAETTVKTHVSRVLAKLGLSSRVQAAIYSQEGQHR
ncbi:response regulator [Arthrobacter castelli]|uniref:response regulator n=1 Tax=Arthrobacter castelli TaxID=271431 RepID=UPI0003F818B9|nr:response regulator transcription factor [Arthrobacter castelli]